MNKKQRTEKLAIKISEQEGMPCIEVVRGRSRKNSRSRDRLAYMMQEIGCSLEEIRRLIGWTHTGTAAGSIRRCIERMHNVDGEMTLINELRREVSL